MYSVESSMEVIQKHMKEYLNLLSLHSVESSMEVIFLKQEN